MANRLLFFSSRVARNSVAYLLPQRDICISKRVILTTLFRKECGTAYSTLQSIENDSVRPEDAARSSKFTKSTDHMKPVNVETDLSGKKGRKTKRFIKTVNLHDYEMLQQKIYDQLTKKEKVKIADIRVLIYNTRSVAQLEKIKSMMHLFQQESSFFRKEISTMIVTMFIRIGFANEVLHIISDPDKYGIVCNILIFNKLMREFARKGDMESFMMLRKIRERLGFEVLRYEDNHNASACVNALINKLCNKEPGTQHMISPDCLQEMVTLKQDVQLPNIVDEENASIHSDAFGQVQEELGVCDETVENCEGVKTDCDSSSFTERTNTDDSVTEETKKVLDYILSLCHDQCKRVPPLSHNPYYFVQGNLVQKGLYSLSQYIIDKLNEEKTLPQLVLFNLTLNHYQWQFQYGKVIEVLKDVKESEVCLSEKRLLALQALFENCPNEDYRRAFKDLNLTSVGEDHNTSKEA